MHIKVPKIITSSFAAPLIALLVVAGLAVHDTKLDKLTVLAIAIPTTIATLQGSHLLLLASDAHTHVERVSFGNAAGKKVLFAPWLTRSNEDRYRRNRATKGNQPFEDYHLPVTA